MLTEIEIVEEIVEKHAEGTSTLYRVSTGILKKPFTFFEPFLLLRRKSRV